MGSREVPHGPVVSRRAVLKGLGAGTAWVAFPPLRAWASPRAAEALHLVLPKAPGVPSIVLQATRRADMLTLRIEGWNLQQVAGPALQRIVPGAPTFVVVELPGQHVFEQATLYGNPVPIPGPGVARLLANPTRLAFAIPNNVTSIPVSVDALLGWAAWQPSLVAAALPPNPGPPLIAAPTATETSVEVPWNLVLSPDANGRWSHLKNTADHVLPGATWTELWHTMLGVDDGAGGVTVPPAALANVSAVWTPGYPNPQADPFSPVSLTGAQRVQLVQNMASYVAPGGGPRTPIPARAELLMLTALGATMNVAGYWPGANLLAWRHRTSLGRDTYVRVVQKGYLFPFGHRAALVTISERIFDVDSFGDMVGYLRQRQFVVVRDPVVDLTTAPYTNVAAPQQRESPFRQIELTTLSTPDLDMLSSAKTDVGAGLTHPDCFWLVAGGNDVIFGVRATDWSGRVVVFDLPMIFVNAGSSAVNPYDPTLGSGGVAGMLAVRNAYVGSGNDARRTRPMQGQKIAYAMPTAPGDTDVVTDDMSFDADAWNGDPTNDAPAYVGVMSSDPSYGADVKLEQVKALTGQDTDLRVIWSDVYITDGFGGANAGDTFLEVPGGNVIGLQTPVDKVGGMATPKQNIEVLGKNGPKGDRANAKQGVFDPSSLFPDDAKVMGGLQLNNTLVTVNDPLKAAQKGINFKYVQLVDQSLSPIGFQYTMTFVPDLQPDPLGILEIKKDSIGNVESTLSLAVALSYFYDDSPTQLAVHGKFEKVVIHLFGNGPAEFIALGLEEATFDVDLSAQLKLDMTISSVTFGAALKFLKDLSDLLPSGLPFQIKLGSDGVELKTDLPKLGIAVGLFAIQNLKMDVGIALPFDGSEVKLKLYWSEKDDPFTIAVSFFGGAAYVEIVIGISGAERITIGFSFGMFAEINIGIGSGGVYMMFGLVFELESDPNKTPQQQVTLVGFFRAGGGVKVLGGIVSIVIDLYLALAYKDVGKAYGKARFTISVSVSIFSISVGFECERQVSGTASDPTFGQMFTTQDWSDYCGAFA